MRIIAFFIGILMLIGILTVGQWAYRYYTAEIRGIVGQEERVQSPLHRMGAYERFYSLCHTVISHEATITAQRSALNDTTDESERRRLRANIAGIEAQRVRTIEEYNSRARMSHTQGQFQAADLPYQLNHDTENTQC